MTKTFENRMNTLAAAALMLGAALTACTTSTPTPTPPAPTTENGASCPCEAPHQCIHVVGRNPESARQECWIPCADGTPCPGGMSCNMIHDGPGQVCTKDD